MSHYPIQVKLCLEAAKQGNLDGVKEQVRQLLHSSDGSLVGEPRWLYKSMLAGIEQQNVDIVQHLLDENVVADKKFPAETAVRARAFDILKLFLDRGWNINQPDRNEPPVLGIPLSDPTDQDMAIWLLDHGADLNRACDLDLTPMSYAMTDASLPMIDMLFSKGGNVRNGQLLHYAVLRESPDALELVRKLIEKHGAPFDEVKYEKVPDSFSKRSGFGLGTALHRTAELGKRDIVEYLLWKGANPVKLDTKGKTPRFWAEERGYEEIADILKSAEEQQQGLNN